jgi:hypothetical protein
MGRSESAGIWSGRFRWKSRKLLTSRTLKSESHLAGAILLRLREASEHAPIGGYFDALTTLATNDLDPLFVFAGDLQKFRGFKRDSFYVTERASLAIDQDVVAFIAIQNTWLHTRTYRETRAMRRKTKKPRPPGSAALCRVEGSGGRTEGQGLQSLVNGTRPEPGGHPRKQTALTWLIVGKQNAAGTMRGSGGGTGGILTALATEHDGTSGISHPRWAGVQAKSLVLISPWAETANGRGRQANEP